MAIGSVGYFHFVCYIDQLGLGASKGRMPLYIYVYTSQQKSVENLRGHKNTVFEGKEYVLVLFFLTFKVLNIYIFTCALI